MSLWGKIYRAEEKNEPPEIGPMIEKTKKQNEILLKAFDIQTLRADNMLCAYRVKKKSAFTRSLGGKYS